MLGDTRRYKYIQQFMQLIETSHAMFYRLTLLTVIMASASGCAGIPATAGSGTKEIVSAQDSKLDSKTPELPSMQPSVASVIPAENAAKQLIEIDTELGRLQVEFYADKAPIVVAELVNLVRSGYFNSDTILEIRSGLGFVIAKVGGTVKTFQGKDEPNTLSSIRGSIAISKSSVSIAYLNNIFIGFQNQPALEQHYIIIGQVKNGLELIEKSPPGVRYKVRGFKLDNPVLSRESNGSQAR